MRSNVPVLLPADPSSPLQAVTKQYVDALLGPTEKTANKSISSAKVPNGYIGADANGLVSSSMQYSATATQYGILRLTGDLGGTSATPTVPALATKADTSYVDNLLGRVSVKNYGALGDGTTNDQGAIQNAINACPDGGTVFFPPGIYGVSSPLMLPANITLQGSHGDTITYNGGDPPPCLIKVLANFSGAGVIRILGKADSGESVDHQGARCFDITIDGSACTTAGIRGFQVMGLVRELILERCTVRRVTDTGFWFGAGATSGLFPQSSRLNSCLADNCANNGYTFLNMPDSTLIDCQSLGAGVVGFYLAGFMNGQLSNCRAEWSAQQGFYFTSGYWGNGQGSGGCNVMNCSTDRSGSDGFRIDAQGSASLIFTNCFNRRDGRNGGTGGGGFAGFKIMTPSGGGLVMPVSVVNHSCYPGVDDGGAGTNSPQIGISVQSASQALFVSGVIHAATTAVVDAGTNTSFLVDNSVLQATGTTASPTRATPVADAMANDPRFRPGQGDGGLYGDRFSTFPRAMATAAKATLGNGYLYYSGGIAGQNFSATKLRIACTAASAGSGSILLAIFTGASTAALTRVATYTTTTGVAATTFYELALSATVNVTAGQYVYMALLTTGWSTVPTFNGLANAGIPATMMNPGTSMYYAVNFSTASQTAIPTTANLTTGYTINANQHWFALAS